jgi:hypothetical protein
MYYKISYLKYINLQNLGNSKIQYHNKKRVVRLYDIFLYYALFDVRLASSCLSSAAAASARCAAAAASASHVTASHVTASHVTARCATGHVTLC